SRELREATRASSWRTPRYWLFLIEWFPVGTEDQRLARLGVSGIAVVFGASIVIDAGPGGHLPELFGHDPGLGQCLGVFDGNLNLDRGRGCLSNTSCRVGLIAENQTGSIENHVLVAESLQGNCGKDECVAFPMTDRVSVVSGLVFYVLI